LAEMHSLMSPRIDQRHPLIVQTCSVHVRCPRMPPPKATITRLKVQAGAISFGDRETERPRRSAQIASRH
jgi:hypothetical protein